MAFSSWFVFSRTSKWKFDFLQFCYYRFLDLNNIRITFSYNSFNFKVVWQLRYEKNLPQIWHLFSYLTLSYLLSVWRKIYIKNKLKYTTFFNKLCAVTFIKAIVVWYMSCFVEFNFANLVKYLFFQHINLWSAQLFCFLL